MDGPVLPSTAGIFDVELAGDTIIVTPAADLDELVYQEIEAGAKGVLTLLRRTPARNVVVDLHRTDCCGSTAVGIFVRLGRRAKRRRGRMAFCNVSGHEQEILLVTNLGGLGPICSSKEEALRAVRG